jgi:hypothetical protein
MALAESRKAESDRQPAITPQRDKRTGEPKLHPDESGWLFLGRLVATSAGLRFTSKKNVKSEILAHNIHLDRSAMPEKTHVQGFATAGVAKNCRSAASK